MTIYSSFILILHLLICVTYCSSSPFRHVIIKDHPDKSVSQKGENVGVLTGLMETIEGTLGSTYNPYWFSYTGLNFCLNFADHWTSRSIQAAVSIKMIIMLNVIEPRRTTFFFSFFGLALLHIRAWGQIQSSSVELVEIQWLALKHLTWTVASQHECLNLDPSEEVQSL